MLNRKFPLQTWGISLALGLGLSYAGLTEDAMSGWDRIPSAQLPDQTTLGFSFYSRLANSGDLPDAFNSLLVNDKVVQGTRPYSAYLMATDHVLGISLGGARFYQINAALPVYYQDLSWSNRTYSEVFAGDLRLGLQLSRAFGEGDKPWAIGFQLGGTLPTSDPGTGPVPRALESNPTNALADISGSHAGGSHLGDSRVGISLTLDFSKRLNPVPLIFTATSYTRTTGIFSKANDDFFDIIGWGAQLEWKAMKGLSLFTEYVHEGRFEEQLSANTELNDVGAGLAYQFANGISLVGGAQWGVYNNGGAPGQFVPDDGKTPVKFQVLGAPDVQVYAGITWELGLGSLDPDADGIMGEFDKCPLVAEDADGFQDNDGCPDADNDQDDVPDLKDNCPNQAEDKDGFEDEDGCPELDNDQDGIPDAKDTCPNDIEDKDGFEDADGCPDLDNDHDGVLDMEDQCPMEPQGVGGISGCPVRDADGDGISDDKDECPNEKEVVNGFKDQDGCPDKAPIEEKTLVLKGVNFESGKAILTVESYPALEDLVAQLQASPLVELEVSGHTDSRGNASKNQQLSQARAQAVADFLVNKGVVPTRLKVLGYGSTKPLATNKSAEGRMLNRRVEFNRIK